MTTPPTIFDHVLVALLAVVIPLYAVLRTQPRMKREIVFDTPTKLGTYWSNGIVQWLAVAVVGAAWLLAGRSLEDLGLAWPDPAGRDAALALSCAFGGWYVIEIWWQLGSEARRRRTIERWQRDTPFMPTTGRELAHFTFLAVTAAVCEEILFRAYIISYLVWFTGGTGTGLAIAVTAPALVFGLSHMYQGWKIVARIVGLAIAFGALYVITRSILVPVLLHLAIDGIAGILSWRLMPSQHPTPAPEEP